MHRRICLRLCKESARKTGFRRGTCTVKDNNHYCHCYNHVCAPPQPPRKGPPPPTSTPTRRKNPHQHQAELIRNQLHKVNGGFGGGLELDVIGKFGEDKDTSNCGGVHGVDYLTVTGDNQKNNKRQTK
ncbi:hypothetical protein YC2023_052565 [Brassica napus]